MPEVSKYSSCLSDIGASYNSLREEMLQADSIGLTQLYNRFHSPEFKGDKIDQLRDLHRDMDQAVLLAYGWGDIALEHDFHEVTYLPEKDRVRFTLSERARLEVLRRLADLNHQRFEEEVEQGLHRKGAQGNAIVRLRSREKSAQKSFDLEGESALAPKVAGNPDRATEAIRAFLKAQRSWMSKSDILANVDIPDGQWNTAINDLLARGTVERQGERRGARYRISESD